MDVLTVRDIAHHFKISERRARALIENRHERYGVGQKIGGVWIVERKQLPMLVPDKKYKRKE